MNTFHYAPRKETSRSNVCNWKMKHFDPLLPLQYLTEDAVQKIIMFLKLNSEKRLLSIQSMYSCKYRKGV